MRNRSKIRPNLPGRSRLASSAGRQSRGERNPTPGAHRLLLTTWHQSTRSVPSPVALARFAALGACRASTQNVRSFIVAWLAVLLTFACGTAPQSGTRDAGAEAGPPRVFVEAVLVTVPPESLGTLAHADFSEVASRTEGSVISAHMLLDVGRRSRFACPTSGLDPNEVTYTWTLEPSLVPNGRVRIGVKLAADTDVKPARTTLELDDGQLAILPTLLPAPKGKVLVGLLRPHVVHGWQDLQDIYDRKREARDAAR
jgi:hypothetical protein